ncbi:MAG: hypothetical protein MI924_31975 [Chloroflexales bacterium]|nr:hypothetical protein [Chloroflexales bacterium]
MMVKQAQDRAEQTRRKENDSSEWNDLVAAIEAELEQSWTSASIRTERREQNEAV